MKDFIEQLSNPVILLNTKGDFIQCNKVMEDLKEEMQKKDDLFDAAYFGIDLSEAQKNSVFLWECNGYSSKVRLYPLLHGEEGYLLLFDKGATVTDHIDSVLEVTEDIVIITDAKGHLKRYNQRAKDFFEDLGEEVVLHQVFKHKGYSLKNNPVSKAISSKEAVSINHTYGNGQTITYTCTPTFDLDGEVRFVVVVGQDITKILQDEKKLQQTLEEKNRYLTEIQHFSIGKLIIDGEKMQRLTTIAKKVAKSNMPVLLEGETGSGKELFARLIHVESDRSEEPFIAVNCAAIAPHLMESELFGYAPGSFTDARKDGKVGLLEMADGGTLFLDEIAELGAELQAKLLRVTQNGTFHALGSSELKKVDIRYISATNANLEQMENFRKDLYYRLGAVKLHIPPLRERKENILPMVEIFLKENNEKYKKNIVLTEEVENFLVEYPWPGNVRQLKNIIERIVVLSGQNIPSLEEIEFFMGIQEEPEIDASMSIKGEMSLKQAYQLLDEALVKKAKEEGASTVKEVSQLLEVSPSTLYRKNLDKLI